MNERRLGISLRLCRSFFRLPAVFIQFCKILKRHIKRGARHYEYPKLDEKGRYYITDANGMVIKFSNYIKETSFYIYIHRELSLDYRKKHNW